MHTFRRGVVVCLLLAATTGCDRVTKHYAMSALAGEPVQSYLGDTLRLEYHENAGGFLSAGADWQPETRAMVFQVANGAFLVCALFMVFRYQWSRSAAIGLVLFIAGGVSNLIDRVTLGTVVDFLNVGVGSLRTGIFNVADVAIMAGTAILLVDPWLARRRSRTGVSEAPRG